MKHFVSVVFNQKDINETQIVESMLSSANIALMESHTVYGLFESENENLVLKLRLDRELTESESDAFADRLANKLFDQGYDDFDIEVSVEGVEIYEQARPLNLNDYKRQIEAAGPYTVNAAGTQVTMRDGSSTVAGITDNGTLWSGNQVITNIVNRGQTDSRQPTRPGTTTSAPRSSREPSGSLSVFAQAGQGGIANNPEETGAIRELQDKLRAAGFDPGATDGRYGPRTANAVRQFQQANNLSVDGDAGPETIQALLAAEPEAPAEPATTEPTAEPEAPAEPATTEPTAEPEAPAEPATTEPTDNAVYKVVTGSGVINRRWRSYDADGNQVRSGRGRGPALPSREEWEASQQGDQAPATAINTLQSAREVWNEIKSMRDATPQGPERRRLSNLMNEINVSTTSPEDAAKILARARTVTGTDDVEGNTVEWSINDSEDFIDLNFSGRTVRVNKQQPLGDILEATSEDGTVLEISQEYLPELHAALSNMISPANESINYDNPILEAFESSEVTYDGNEFLEADPFLLPPGLRMDLDARGRTSRNSLPADTRARPRFVDAMRSSGVAGSSETRPTDTELRQTLERSLRAAGVDVTKPSVAAKLARLVGRIASRGLGAASAAIPDPVGLGSDYSQLQTGLDLSKPEDQIEYERRIAAFQRAQRRITDRASDTPRLDDVSPRPTGSSTRALRAQRAWDRKYGQTHNLDGTVNVRANEEITTESPLKGSRLFMHGPIPATSSGAKHVVMPNAANKDSDYNLLAMDLDLNDPDDAKEFEERIKIWQEMQQDISNRSDQSRNESVGPRPVGAFLFRERADWDKKYGSTHYKDGTKKPRRSFFESRDIKEVTYDGNDFFEVYGVMWFNEDDELDEAEYQGRKVKLGKPMRGDVKKFKVYVRNPKGNVVKVNFGDPDMKIKKSNPARRRSFRARHNCDNPGPRHKARFWSCRAW